MKLNKLIAEIEETFMQNNKTWSDFSHVVYKNNKDKTVKKCKIGQFLEIINSIEIKNNYTLGHLSFFKIIGNGHWIEYSFIFNRLILINMPKEIKDESEEINTTDIFYKNIIEKKVFD